MRDFIDFFAPVLLFAVIIIGGVVFLGNYWEAYRCRQYTEITGRETKWVFLDTCYIYTGDDWLRRDEYAAVSTAREGLQSK